MSVILDNGDNVGVVTCFEPPEDEDLLTPEAIAAIKIAVSKGQWRDDIRAGMWVGKAIGQVLKRSTARSTSPRRSRNRRGSNW